jgi:hypothetical protein
LAVYENVPFDERAEKVILIVQAERLARALGTTLSEMLAKVEREANAFGDG